MCSSDLGIDPLPRKPLDGKSLKPLLEGKTSEWEDRILISSWKNRVGARGQRFRLDHQGRLYDMTIDAGQRFEINEKFPEQLEKMRARVQEFREKVLSGSTADERPFTVGHPGVSWTQLPARDAKPRGGIKRSSKHPNCSYFLNWTRVEDAISWEVEVATPGFYEVELWFACPVKDLGSVMTLSFQGRTARAKVTEAVNPPLLDRQDRSPRIEGWVKDFQPMKMGKINLPGGKGLLELRAVEIPGDQAMEFRLLTLNRVSNEKI